MTLRFTLSATNLQLSDITVTNVVAPNTEATALDFTLSASQLQLSNAEIIAGWVAPTVDVSMANLVAAAIVAARMEAADIWLNANPKDRAFIEVPELVDQLAYSLSRIQSDVADLSDTTAIAFSTGFAEAASLFDAAILSLNLGPVDNVTFTETLTFVIQSVLHDTVTMEEQHAFSVSRPASDSFTVSDLAALHAGKFAQDSLLTADSSNLNIGKGLLDAPVLTDVFERVAQFQRAFIDTVSLDDFSHVDKEWSGTKQNVTFTSDSSQWGINKAVTDSAALTELALIDSQKVLADTAATLDVLTQQFSKSHTDSVGLNETLALATVFVRSFSDAVTLADLIDVFNGRILTEADAATPTDLARVSFGLARTDLAALSDSLDHAIAKSVEDSTAATDTLSHALNYQRGFTDTVSLDDTSNVDKNWDATKQNVAFTSDAHIWSIAKAETESVLATDAALIAAQKVIADTASTGDSVAYTTAFQRAFSDVVSLDDISNVDKNWDATKQNVAFTSDSALLTLGQSHTDSALIDDAYAYAASKVLTDSVGFSDAISIQLNSGSTPVFNGFTFNSNTFG